MLFCFMLLPFQEVGVKIYTINGNLCVLRRSKEHETMIALTPGVYTGNTYRDFILVSFL